MPHATPNLRSIRTLYLSPERKREEFRALVDVARSLGIERCEVTFGNAWGNDYYSESTWAPVSLALDDLDGEIERASSLGWGDFAENDLWIAFPPHAEQFLFCHECDIHAETSREGPLFGLTIERWQSSNILRDD